MILPVEEKPTVTYAVKEFAQRIGCDPRVVYTAVENGEIPSIRLGRVIRIPREAGDRILREGLPKEKAGKQ